MKTDDVNEIVTVLNPATGQVLNTTAKVFGSIYKDKGFQLVSRDNVDNGNAVPKGSAQKRRSEPASQTGSAQKRRSEPASQTGSAADIAAGLGLAAATDQTAIDAEKGVAGSGAEKTNNENDANSDGSDVTAERESNKRDRGGRR